MVRSASQRVRPKAGPMINSASTSRTMAATEAREQARAARPRLWPSFETRARKSALLRMRAEFVSQASGRGRRLFHACEE
jgi:hypothetical protein